jgi:nickel-dependent lactate racemase
MKTISVPWQAWHGDEAYELPFPASWEVQWCPIADAPLASESKMQQALSCPIACSPLAVVARGRKRVALAVDDLTRLTPTQQIPLVLECLNSADIAARQIIILALGSHPPLTTSELMTKGVALI